MIDIHAHILPGVDDGPSHMDEALEMAQIAVNDGIKTIIATPHSRNGVYNNWRSDIISACDRFTAALDKNHINIEILPGAELFLNVEILDDIKKGRLMTINDTGQYLFLELPQQIILQSVIDFVKHLKQLNITPIIAHPERNLAIQKDLSILHDLISSGALSQITASSLTGAFGPKVLKCCKKIIKLKMVHFMATDAHSPKVRPPKLSEGYHKFVLLAGSTYAKKVMFDAPQALIKGIRL